VLEESDEEESPGFPADIPASDSEVEELAGDSLEDDSEDYEDGSDDVEEEEDDDDEDEDEDEDSEDGDESDRGISVSARKVASIISEAPKEV
jgi:hypothetical protein